MPTIARTGPGSKSAAQNSIWVFHIGVRDPSIQVNINHLPGGTLSVSGARNRTQALQYKRWAFKGLHFKV